MTTPLSAAQGGTGNKNNSATSLTTSRTFITNLGSTDAAEFNGTNNNIHGVTGTLPIANGGTGGSTLAAAQSSLGIVAGAFSPESVSNVPWSVPTMQNGWSISQPTVVRTGYRKVLGMLQLAINLTAGDVTDGKTIFTLPVGYRPSHIYSIPGMTGVGRIDVNPDGTVTTQANSFIGSGTLRVYCLLPLE